MKHLKIYGTMAILLGIFSATQSIIADSSTILAPIKEVVVYPDRALVTRSFQTNLRTGKQTLRFKNGNANLDPNSLRAESKSKTTSIIGIQSSLELTKDSANEEIRNLEKDIRNLENQENSLQLAKQRWIKDLQGIQEYSQFLTFYISEASVQENTGNTKWEDGLQVLSIRRNQSKEKIQSIDSDLEKLKKRIQSKKDQLNKIQSKSGKSHRVIEVSLQASKEDNAEIQFSYIVPNAGWNVSYGMHMNQKDGVRIEYYGNIRQETGEDWNNVDLFLSTSKPSLGGKRESLSPLKILVREIQTKEIFVQTERMTAPAMEEMEDAMMSGVADGGFREESETGGFSGLESLGESLQFKIPKKVNIPSEKRIQIVTIAEFSEKIEDSSFKVFPAIRPLAYQAIRSKNTRSFPLLQGPVNVFRNGGFIGTSSISHTPSGQDFTLGFGVDESLAITRDIKTFREDSGALSSGQFFHTHTKVEMNNQSDQVRKVIILDRIPVSEVSEIQVEIQKDTTQGYKEIRKGILQWELEVPARSKTSIQLHYRVKTPDNYPGTIYGK